MAPVLRSCARLGGARDYLVAASSGNRHDRQIPGGEYSVAGLEAEVRIISKFHDYYDSAAGMGIDIELIYERQTKEIKQEARRNFSTHTLGGPEAFIDPAGYFEGAPHLGIVRYGQGLSVGRREAYLDTEAILNGYVLFCGRAYPVIGLQHEASWTVRNGYENRRSHWCYTIGQIGEALKDLGGEGNGALFERGPAGAGGIWKEWALTRAGMTAAFEALERTRSERYLDLHREYRTPVILITREHVVLNPPLKDIAFWRAVNAFSAFQEISMFLGGVLGSEGRPMVEISDAVRAEKHGLDRTSFRKPPKSA